MTMNRDNTSDLKIVQRFIFENSLYLFNMFEKKIDSFTQVKSKDTRQKQKDYYLKSNPLGIDDFNSMNDPIGKLAKDLTKPVWNCISKVDPRVVLFDDQQQQNSPVLSLFNRLFRMFIQRYKSQHEDESNLKINLLRINKTYEKLIYDKKLSTQNQKKNLQSYTEDLLKMFQNHIDKQIQFLEKSKGEQEEQQCGDLFGPMNRTLQTCHQILNCLLLNENKELTDEFNMFISLIVGNFNNVLDSKIGSLAICTQPKLAFIPLIIHPILIAVNHCLKMQINYSMQKQQQRKQRNNLSTGVTQIQKAQQMNQEQTYVYPSLKTAICSRIAFINLDGFQSEFNIDLAKHLSRYMMYISFPKQSSNKMENNNLRKFQDFNSKRLLEKYLHTGLTQQQKKQLLSYYQNQQKQLKKNLFMFPIHSRQLSDNFQLPNIQFYESSYIKFILNEVVFEQIRQFHPSMIVVSYSPKIRLQNQHWTEIIRELTVLGNYRVAFYPNLFKMYSFEQETPSQMLQTTQYVDQQKQYYEKYEQSINIVDSSSRINTDFLDKLSIFLKVSSGTYNLSRQPQVDSYTEKYKNYKIMSYGGLLMKILGKQYSTMERLKLRANQYLTISKVLANMYSNKTDTFDKLFGTILTKFHHSLLKNVEKKFFSDDKIPENQYPQLLEKINKKYDYVEKKDFWQNFRFEYCLNVSTQKTQSKLYIYLPRYTQGKMAQQKSIDNLIALEFQVQIDGIRTSMEWTKDTKFYYDSRRKHKNALIYATNHLPKKDSTFYHNYIGIIDQQFDIKAQSKVIFKPIQFNLKKQVAFTTTFTQFSYFQTSQYIFLFWPQIFDCQQDMISKMAGSKYTPKISNKIFQAKRSQPQVFNILQIKNNTYTDVLPRYGCTCYQTKQNEQFYIFGGFYNNQQNYLSFQTDITVCRFKDNQGIVENLPKSFYFEFDTQKKQSKTVIKRIHNDLIRPRVQYQIIQPLQWNQGDEKSIFLLGGVGQKFTRPYSMIGYMAHKLTFKNSQLISVQRIKTNNVYPVNVKGPIKNRAGGQMKEVSNNQNRNIMLTLGHVPQDALTFTHHHYRWDSNQQRIEYETQYDFAQTSNKGYREQVSYLKKNITEYPLKYQLRTKCYRGKQLYTNFITITSQTDKKYIQQLQLQISPEIKSIYPNLPSCVRLTGASILAIDINSSIIYALIKHQMFTLNKCVLAFYDVNDVAGKLVDSRDIQIKLRQIHIFDQDVSKNILVAANQFTIAILHGCKFTNNINVPQLVVRRRNNQIKTMKVKSSVGISQSQIFKNSQLSPLKSGHKNNNSANMLSTSLFLNQNHGVILCFSFRSVQRQNNIQKVYVILQELNLTKDQIKWQKKMQKIYDFVIVQQIMSSSITIISPNRQRDGLKIIQIKSKSQKGNINNQYQLILMHNDECYSGIMKQDAERIEFKPMETTVNEYYKNYYKDNIRQDSIMLDKNPYTYEDTRDQSEMNIQDMNNNI